MAKEFLLSLAVVFAISATSARADELWVISAGDDFAYFIDAESIVTVPGDIRKASVHQVFFQPRDVGEETPVRVVSIEFDFDCVASTYQQLFGIGIDDLMNQITSFEASEPRPLNPGTNVGVAGEFACADQDSRAQFAQKLGGDASLEEAVRVSRVLERPAGP
jgi:hypothetical protein